ncbi:hypothetical protein [Schaedlerella arabinosiphila]|nr:hypothetical protein [Schaedlerella arabinosiphila]
MPGREWNFDAGGVKNPRTGIQDFIEKRQVPDDPVPAVFKYRERQTGV